MSSCPVHRILPLVLCLLACESTAPEPLELPTTGAVRGQVLSKTGSRVAMARLTLTSGTTEHSAETDAGGVYSFQSVVPETWTLELQLPSGWILDQGQTGNRIVSVRPNLTAHEDFTLVREPF